MSGNAATRKPGEKLVPPEGMTKSAYKKLLRKQRHEETKGQYRELRKQIKKEKDLKRKEEINKLKEEGKSYDHLVKPRNKNKIIKVIDNGDGDENKIVIDPIDNSKKIRVIIDCGYDDYMNEKEVVSLSSQITRAYSTNRQCVKEYYAQKIKEIQDKDCEVKEYGIAPSAKLIISGVDKRLKERFDKVLPDYSKWDPESAELKTDDLKTVLDNEVSDYSNVIYLSADTETQITELKPGETFIVGGIVDKGRHKNLCKNTAEKLGIRTLRLPIDEFINLSGRKVLTTAHVVELLLKWCEYRDWKKAFEEVLPPRKLKDGEDGKDDYGDNDDE